jgi:2-polyprenyl-3-methyl-5-hydroxy-6-metoxy-1,4-benzoquinol methylase
MLRDYFKSLYARTMTEAYARAEREIVIALRHGGDCLDCGAGSGHMFARLRFKTGLTTAAYHGLEWHADAVRTAQGNGLNVIHSDLSHAMPHEDDRFNTVFGLSVLEHLLNPCRYLRECHRVLVKNGHLIILTPNISTYFTAALILAGRMPSSGPHPDSDNLIKQQELFRVSPEALQHDTETDTPVHRHLVVFSYRVLKTYLVSLGFRQVEGYGFGLYPFPNFMQPAFEKIDPYHCHQMVFMARK